MHTQVPLVHTYNTHTDTHNVVYKCCNRALHITEKKEMMSFTGKWMGLDREQQENRKEARFRQILRIFCSTQNWYLKTEMKTKGRR